MTRSLLVISLCLAGTWSVAGQSSVVLLWDGAPTDEPKSVELTVRPAAEASPALRYCLLPSFIERSPGNAATLYFVAGDLVTQGMRDSTEADSLISQWGSMPLHELPREQMRSLLNSNPYGVALRYAGWAARREHCHWDYPLREPGEAINMRLPNLAKMRLLARLVSVRVRLAIADGDVEQAVEGIQTGFALARHVADGPTLINALVGIGAGALMCQRVEELLQLPDAPNLYWALADLPRPLIDLRHALEYERSMLHLTFPLLGSIDRRTLTPDEWRALLEELARLPELATVAGPDAPDKWQSRATMALLGVKAYPNARRHFLARGLSPDEIDAMPVSQMLCSYWIREYRTWSDELFKWHNLPFWRAHDGLRAAEQRLEKAAGNEIEFPPILILLPSLSRAMFLSAALDRRIDMLCCVEALRAHAAANDGNLPASLGELTVMPIPRDPTTGTSFVYDADGGTFILESPAPSGYRARDARRYRVTLVR